MGGLGFRVRIRILWLFQDPPGALSPGLRIPNDRCVALSVQVPNNHILT